MGIRVYVRRRDDEEVGRGLLATITANLGSAWRVAHTQGEGEEEWCFSEDLMLAVPSPHEQAELRCAEDLKSFGVWAPHLAAWERTWMVHYCV